jgi:flagellin-like protein
MFNPLFCLMKEKRGISPIIATLLLIAFAIALGVVIMNFGRAQVELEAQCPVNVGLKLAEIGGEREICYDTEAKKIKFTVENGVNVKVEGLIFNVIGSEKAESYDVPDAKIIKAGTYLGSISYGYAKSGKIRQIKITPKVILYDEEQICVEKALIVEDVREC